MKVLFLGGTGFISTSVSRLAVTRGIDLYLLNRGKRAPNEPGTTSIVADVHKPEEMQKALRGLEFDAVVDFVAYTVADVERDISIFRGKAKQFIFISSASAYQKPPTHYLITESTPLHNPYWQYSRDKIACEERLLHAYREEGFPITIVRPSLTFDSNFPIAVGGWGCYTLADRLLKGRPVIVHGDGMSLWVNTRSEDFAVGFLGLIGNMRTIGHAFHITTDEVLTWNEIYETIADELGVKAHIVHIPTDFISSVVPELGPSLIGDKACSVVFDNTKIKRFVPGYEAVIPFREGIRRTIAWFDADEKRKRIDPAVNADMDKILAAYGERTGVRP